MREGSEENRKRNGRKKEKKRRKKRKKKEKGKVRLSRKKRACFITVRSGHVRHAGTSEFFPSFVSVVAMSPSGKGG